MMSKKYAETYDGLIFVKTISIPEYNLNQTKKRCTTPCIIDTLRDTHHTQLY